MGAPDHGPPAYAVSDAPLARSAVSPATFRGLAAAAHAAPDGREFLLDVVRRLASAERPAGAPAPLTEEQLRWVLTELADEASS